MIPRLAFFGAKPPLADPAWAQCPVSADADFRAGREDHYQAKLGEGLACFERAKQRLLAYRHFPPQRLQGKILGGAQVFEGATVVQNARFTVVSFEMANRITAVFDRAQDGTREVGFSLATVAGHAELGVETFKVCLKDQEVLFDIRSFSLPGHWLTRLAAPFTRGLQRRASGECLAFMREMTQADAVDWVFYDGLCGLCNGTVQFLLPRDPAGRLAFAPLQGEAAQRLPAGRPDSIAVLAGGPGGPLLTRSKAVLHLASRLQRPWPFFALLSGWIPAALADALYDWIAARRKRLFKGPAQCWVPAGNWRERSLD